MVLALALTAKSAQALDANILYLQQNKPEQALLSNIFNEPADTGLPGAQLAIEDNSTTGRFLQHHYKLTHTESPNPEPLIAAAVEWVQNGEGLICPKVA